MANNPSTNRQGLEAAKGPTGTLANAIDVEDQCPVGVDGLKVGRADVRLDLVADLVPIGLLRSMASSR